jgi:hypothetical protein
VTQPTRSEEDQKTIRRIVFPTIKDQRAKDVTDRLDIALIASGCDSAKVLQCQGSAQTPVAKRK